MKLKLKCCPECFAVHDPAPVCPMCGHTYEVKKRKIEQEPAQLMKIEAYTAATGNKTPSDCRTVKELQEYAKAHNYKKDRVGVIIQAEN